MNTSSSVRFQESLTEEHIDFLSLYPIVERHAHIAFRNRNVVDREEAAAEAVAAAFESYISLRRRGKDPIRDFPSAIATFAVLHVQNDRHVGGKSSSKDVPSRQAQRKRGFQVESLSASPSGPLPHLKLNRRKQALPTDIAACVQDDSQTPVPDQAAFRVDFPEFLTTLERRDRELLEYLALGHSGKAAAFKFNLSPGRVTQLRQKWHRQWLAFNRETPQQSLTSDDKN